jgi:hypothetical protein
MLPPPACRRKRTHKDAKQRSKATYQAILNEATSIPCMARLAKRFHYGFDSLDDPIHSLFPLALAVNNVGHVDIRVTQFVAPNFPALRLRPAYGGNACCGGPENAFIARTGQVRISAKTACRHPRAK